MQRRTIAHQGVHQIHRLVVLLVTCKRIHDVRRHRAGACSVDSTVLEICNRYEQTSSQHKQLKSQCRRLQAFHAKARNEWGSGIRNLTSTERKTKITNAARTTMRTQVVLARFQVRRHHRANGLPDLALRISTRNKCHRENRHVMAKKRNQTCQCAHVHIGKNDVTVVL